MFYFSNILCNENKIKPCRNNLRYLPPSQKWQKLFCKLGNAESCESNSCRWKSYLIFKHTFLLFNICLKCHWVFYNLIQLSLEPNLESCLFYILYFITRFNSWMTSLRNNTRTDNLKKICNILSLIFCILFLIQLDNRKY